MAQCSFMDWTPNAGAGTSPDASSTLRGRLVTTGDCGGTAHHSGGIHGVGYIKGHPVVEDDGVGTKRWTGAVALVGLGSGWPYVRFIATSRFGRYPDSVRMIET